MNKRVGATTLQDVANEAGVSAMTVSVVMNGSYSVSRVSESTREKVREVALRLRYCPNAVAQGLSRRRMDTIGVVAEVDGEDLNLYFLEVLNGIMESAGNYGQNTTVLSVSNWVRDEQRIVKLCDGRVDGIVLIDPVLSPQFARQLAYYVPFVAIRSNSSLEEALNLDCNDEAGAFEIVKYLIDQGHQDIMHFRGDDGLRGTYLRQEGYRRALEESGILYRDSLVMPGSSIAESGRECARRLLRLEGSLHPSAIFCANDAIAYGCMEVFREEGVSVPRDMSVVGFGDTMLARTTIPPLTTIRQPMREMGKRAICRLLPKIRGESDSASCVKVEMFNVDLIRRGSVGPPRRLAS